MSDTEYNRLLEAAKERALFGFLALIQRAMQEAERTACERMSGASSSLEHSTLTALRHFLRQDGNVFLRRIDTLFRGYLDRAMQTMYIDMRPDMLKLSADELSLVDDEAVHHQIEVGRLVQRMREADEEGIGRLNVIISNIHGRHDAKERENPFRPYLLARALYEAVRETVNDEGKARLLFEQMSNALLPHLPAYYGAIRQVFEDSGMHGKFVAQQSRAAHFQRYFGAPAAEPGTYSSHLGSRVVPELQHMMETLQLGFAAQAGAGAGERSVHDFIRAMLDSSRASAPPGMNGPRNGLAADADNGTKAAGASGALAAQLAGYQKKIAQGEVLDAARADERNQLFAVRERMNLDKAPLNDRMTLEVVAMLFEFILEDEQMPAPLRMQIGRLQIPVLRAAVLDARLLHDENHPARRLLNRMASAAVASDPVSADGQRLAAQIGRTVDKVLQEFDGDASVFGSSLAEFEDFLAQHLRRDHAQTAAAIEAVETAEKLGILLNNVTAELCDLLLPLNADKRISDFIIRVWPQVLVRAAWQDADKKLAPDAADSAFRVYRDVLPDFMWSIQEKQGAQEKSALIRLLPDLVKRLTQAFKLIQLPEDESRQVMDQLVEMHTQVLRGAQFNAALEQPTRDRLRQDFARLAIHWERVSWAPDTPPQPRGDLIEEVMSHYGVAAGLNLGIKTIAATAADREFLAQTYLLGTRVEIRAGDTNQAAQLVWVSTHRSLYLFRQESGELALYTSAALLEALRDGAIFPVEYAPVFERAVESLLFGAEKIQGGR